MSLHETHEYFTNFQSTLETQIQFYLEVKGMDRKTEDYLSVRQGNVTPACSKSTSVPNVVKSCFISQEPHREIAWKCLDLVSLSQIKYFFSCFTALQLSWRFECRWVGVLIVQNWRKVKAKLKKIEGVLGTDLHYNLLLCEQDFFNSVTRQEPPLCYTHFLNSIFQFHESQIWDQCEGVLESFRMRFNLLKILQRSKGHGTTKLTVYSMQE